MSNILIINGAKEFAHSKGQLNDTLTEVADGFLRDAGHDVKVVRADSSYDVKAEVQNFLWADVVIWQMPGWWMGAPWTVKKYMDDVFTEGHGSLYASDGRTRSDASKKYGSGGLIQAVLDQFAKIIPIVLKEEGCHGYAPMVDAATDASFQATAPDSIIMVEQWETVAHLEAHLQTAHMKAWSDAVKGDVLETHIRILEQGV